MGQAQGGAADGGAKAGFCPAGSSRKRSRSSQSETEASKGTEKAEKRKEASRCYWLIGAQVQACRCGYADSKDQPVRIGSYQALRLSKLTKLSAQIFGIVHVGPANAVSMHIVRLW